MKYIVPVLYTVEAKSVADAQNKVNIKLHTGTGVASFNIGEATAQIGDEKPAISKALDEFMTEVINQNYDDPNNGRDDPDNATTTLKYVADTMGEMSDEDIADWSDSDGNYRPENNGGVKVEEVVGALRIELTALIEKYGGGTLAHKFIKDEDDEDDD